MTNDRRRTTPRIEPSDGPPGITVVDPIESATFTLRSDDPVDPEPCDTAPFHFPVDVAAVVDVGSFETPYAQKALVHDQDGTVIAESRPGETVALDEGRYDVELTSTPMKVYLQVVGGITVESDDDGVELTFSGGAAVRVGARSLHDHPAATITTTDDPADVMTAVSAFGSALKTTSCERSFPTLRGHPPLLERGEALDVPAELTRPETGVEIVVPPELGAVFPVAPLAYYLGARVRPGAEPALHAGGERFDLTAAGDLETTAARTLEQVFLLDCVTRTEGYYRVDLYERRLVEGAVDLAFADLYDRPLAEQVTAYLAVPYDRIAHAVPRWKLVADVRPAADHVPVLPHLANELAHVRCPTDLDTVESNHDVFEQAGSERGDAGDAGAGSKAPADDVPPFVEPAATDSFEHAYVGDGIPLGASKTSAEAYQRRLEWGDRDAGRIRVAVVINDERMRDETVVSERYDVQDHLEFDVVIREATTVAELRELLRAGFDFLHYVGHVDERGIQCADGFLDAESLGSVSLGAFFLNACHSYAQGRALVDRGALGGVVTLDEVLDPIATRIGVTLARLLGLGYSLHAALEVVPRENRIASTKYLVVGDGNAQVVEGEDPTPYVVTVERRDDAFDVTQVAYPSGRNPLGAIGTTFSLDDDVWYLTAGEGETVRMSAAELDDYLSKDRVPVAFGGRLYWSDEVETADLTGPE